MNKTSLIVRLTATVLSAGLVSCAKDDTKTRDVFRAPPPVIHQKGAQDLKTWDLRSDKSLDLQDSFDVSAGQPAKLEVTARCRRDKISSIESFQFVPREPIKIFQVLPGDLLTRDLANEKNECAFELILSNAVGSKHIYNISTTSITDLTGAGAALEKTGTDEKVMQIHSRKLDGYRVRYRNSGSAAAQIFCQDMILPDIPFEQVMDLIHFDFSKPELKAGLPPDVLAENPLQPCRVLIRSAGQLRQIGPRFLVRLPQKPMVTTIVHAAPNKDQKFQFYGGAPLNIGNLDIQNPNRSLTRTLIVRKAAGESKIEMFGPVANPGIFNKNSITVNAFTLNWLNLGPLSSSGISLEDKGDHWRIAIPGGFTARIALHVVPNRARVCPDWSVVVLSEDLAISGKIQFSEVSDAGEVLDERQIVFPRTSYPGAQQYEKKPLNPINGSPCAW